jgi:hypothetical protein
MREVKTRGKLVLGGRKHESSKESKSQGVKENARRGAPQAQKCSICLVPRATPWSNIQCMPI